VGRVQLVLETPTDDRPISTAKEIFLQLNRPADDVLHLNKRPIIIIIIIIIRKNRPLSKI
jgi:hypothetical protein